MLTQKTEVLAAVSGGRIHGGAAQNGDDAWQNNVLHLYRVLLFLELSFFLWHTKTMATVASTAAGTAAVEVQRQWRPGAAAVAPPFPYHRISLFP